MQFAAYFSTILTVNPLSFTVKTATFGEILRLCWLMYKLKANSHSWQIWTVLSLFYLSPKESAGHSLPQKCFSTRYCSPPSLFMMNFCENSSLCLSRSIQILWIALSYSLFREEVERKNKTYTGIQKKYNEKRYQSVLNNKKRAKGIKKL